MENKNEKELNNMFDRFKGEWDTEEPALGHQERFLHKLEGKKKRTGLLYWITLPAAAAVILIGLFITLTRGEGQLAIKVSPQTEKTQMHFASIIENELAKVEKEHSPETKMLVEDALSRMEKLEKDYDKITLEIAKQGENKQLIHAMITNLQTRIAFLEDVLTKIENIKKIKEKYHENTQA